MQCQTCGQYAKDKAVTTAQLKFEATQTPRQNMVARWRKTFAKCKWGTEMKSANTSIHEDEATGRRIPGENMGMQMGAPPLGRWTRDWVWGGCMRKEIVGYAIEDAERNVAMWQNSPDAGAANINLDLAYHALGDILNWLYGRR